MHMGASGAPWFVNPIKGHLPLLDGDGRVSSSDDATHETSASTSTEALDDARRNARHRGALTLTPTPTLTPTATLTPTPTPTPTLT